MSTTNHQDQEDNYENLFDKEAIKKIKELTDTSSACFFCTNIKTGNAFETRPMVVQKVDDKGNFWFLSNINSNKTEEIGVDFNVQLLFKGSDYSDFLNIYGIATINQDKEKIKELWNPMLKTWFNDGVDDPQISVIKVKPTEGYYWDTKHNKAIGLIKRLTGAVIGKTIDDSIEGNLVV